MAGGACRDFGHGGTVGAARGQVPSAVTEILSAVENASPARKARAVGWPACESGFAPAETRGPRSKAAQTGSSPTAWWRPDQG